MMSTADFLEACYEGNVEFLKRYVEKGNEVNCTGISGNSGLRMGCLSGNVETVKYLLENGADPNFELWLTSRVDGRKLCEKGFAIFYATSKEVVDVMLEYGADVSAKDLHGKSVEEWWRKLGIDEKLISTYF